jgi:hypothetical protein
MKEGLLTEKGKPNDKTPKDWFLKYKEYSHSGEVLAGSGDQLSTSQTSPLLSSPNGEKVKTETKEEEEIEPTIEKKKKKKKKKKKEEKSDSE